MSRFFDNLIKATENKYAGKVSDGNDADVAGFISTGSLSLDAILSASVENGGLPSNKVTAIAGDPSTGKTFLALHICKKFLEEHQDGVVMYFESESAVTTDMLIERDIDIDRFYILPVATLQEFRTQAVRVIDGYLEEEEKNRKPMFMVLDSLGMLSTSKEVADIAEGKDTRDMTRSQIIRGAFRVITLKLGRAKVALLVTNHTYAQIGAYVPTKVQSGGDGLPFAASTIIFLSKSKKRDATTKEVTGAIITAKNTKARLTVENKEVEILLDYQLGLNKYYGILDIAAKHDVIKKISTQYEFPNGEKAQEGKIYKNPEKFFTPDVMKLLEEAVKKEFKYGSAQAVSEDQE